MPLDPKLLQRLIQNDPTLTELELFHQKLTIGDIKQLVQALETNNVVQIIHLDDNSINDDGAAELAKIDILSLVHLELGNNNIGARGASALAAGKFTSLGLSHNSIGDEGAIALVTQSTTLTSLDISSNRITDKAMGALGNNPRLTSLVMHCNSVTDAGAIDFAKRNKSVEYLHLFSNQVGDAGAAALAKHPALKKLVLAWNKVTDKGALTFKNNTVLEELDLKKNSISAEAIEELSQSKTLKYLRYNDRDLLKLEVKRAAEAAPAAKSNPEKRAAEPPISRPVTRSSSKKQAVATPQTPDRPSPNKLSPG